MELRAQIITVDEAINRVKMGRFQLQVLFATGTCFMADSMQVMLLSFLTRLLQREWKFDKTIGSTITSSLFAGAMIGTLILGPAGDRIGRKPILMISAIIISIFGASTALCNNYWSVMAATFVVGFGIGGLTVPFDILAEFLPGNERGKYLLLIKYFWTIGSCIIPLVAYISIEIAGSWRLFTILCALPSLLSFVISSLFVPESPRWLASSGHKEKALQILREAAKRNGVNVDIAFPANIQLADEEIESSDFSELFKPRWRRLTLTLWIVWAGFAFTYFSIIMAITRIFDEEDDADNMDFDYFAIFISSASEFVGTALAIQVIDRIGRVKALVVSFFLGGGSMFMVCMLDGILTKNFIIAFAFIARASEMAAACITWISTAELLSTSMRSTGHAAANSVARCGAFLSPFLVNEGSLGTIGIALLIASVIAALAASNLPETNGVELGKAIIMEEREDIRRMESGEEPLRKGFFRLV